MKRVLQVQEIEVYDTITLTAFKTIIHWIFGLAVKVGYCLGVKMYPPQIFYFTGFVLLVPMYATYISLLWPAGPMPATYGHLQTIIDPIDDRDDRMFWAIKRAVTSAKRLPMPMRADCTVETAELLEKKKRWFICHRAKS